MAPSQTILIKRLTHGPKHHLFGYYGISAWDSRLRYHLVLETDFHDRAPARDDQATVALVDMQTDDLIPYAKTRAFNSQQGSMMHWIDVGFGEEFTYNDWEGDRLVARTVNPETGHTRTLQAAIAAISPDRQTAMGLNFARMRMCRRVVGYANDLYAKETVTPIPEDDGLYRIDLRTGAAQLVLPIAAVAAAASVTGGVPIPGRGPVWFNHVVFNPTGDRLLFFCRRWGPEGRIEAAWSVKPDGTDLRCQIGYGARISHFAWLDAEHIVISTDVLGAMQFVQVTEGHSDFVPFGEGLLPSDGHNAFSPDRRWMVYDTRTSDHEMSLLLYDVIKQRIVPLGQFYQDPAITGDWRCDLHPRWSPDGAYISIDSIHEGTRQVYVVEMPDEVIVP